jgi:histidine triad (HIT) family protein
MNNCIFCKIVNKEIPSTIVYEDENYIAFNDIAPKAKTHILIIPKKHIERFDKIDSEEDLEIVKGLFEVADTIIKEKKIDGCRLQINCGKNHGQEVFHIHMHLISHSSINN